MLHVDEVIGRGSFGTVYRGRMRSPDGLVRRVAVKVLSDAMSRDTRAVARFRDEARLLALIDHPGLVPVYALQRFGDRWAVVMGYVDGFELARAVRHEPLPPETVRQVGIQVAEILDALWSHAHPENGEPLQVVHRDVKPHNLMIDLQGRVRLLDLGVASARFEARESTTVAGEVAGTLAYMSPQRWARIDDGHSGDIYALGATLYQLATGELAQEAGPDPGVHAERMAAGAQTVPKVLFDWIARAMAFDDKERPTAAELAAGLRAIGELDGLGPREWANDLAARHPVHDPSRGKVDPASDFLGAHTLGTDTILTTRFLDDDLATSFPPSVTVASGGTRSPELPSDTPPPSRRGLVVAGAVALGLLVVAALTQVGPRGPSGPPIRVALAPTDPITVVPDHTPLAVWLGKELDRPVELIVGDSYDDTAQRLARGEVDFAQLPHRAGLHAMDTVDGIRPLATKRVDGTSGVEPYLVARREETSSDLADFVGSTICYADPLSNTGYKIPRTWIAAQGYDPDVDFGTHISGDHGQILRDLIDGTCRLGGTFNRNLMTAEQRGLPGARLKVFALVGESIPHDSWYAGPDTDPQLAARVQDLLLGLDPEQALGVEVIGESERISGFGQPVHAR